jgi:hypothetical protein
MLRKFVAASLGVGEVVTAPVPADWNDFVTKPRVERAQVVLRGDDPARPRVRRGLAA